MELLFSPCMLDEDGEESRKSGSRSAQDFESDNLRYTEGRVGDFS